MLATVVHNPYTEKEHARKLFDDLKRARRAIEPTAAGGGIKMGDLAKGFGGVKVRYRMPDDQLITKEEWDRKHGDRQQAERHPRGEDEGLRRRDEEG
jgi:hypothetical protein